MSQAVSPSSGKAYGLARVCRVWRVPRSSVYFKRTRENSKPVAARKRGPRSIIGDEELSEKIKQVLKESPWVGEGYRKVWARLRDSGIRVSQRRVLRIMREKNLLAKERPKRRHNSEHKGTIIPDRPDSIWGIDLTSTQTDQGLAGIFVVVDHYTAELLGVHATLTPTRFEAMYTLGKAVKEVYKNYDKNICQKTSLKLRHDHGSQFTSHRFQEELKFLGIEPSPAYVKEPETNGCAERMIRTLKEQVLWLKRFSSVEELNRELQRFKERYNSQWIIQRHGFMSPSQVRKRAENMVLEAA